MRSYVRPGAVALAAILGACASTPAPVPVAGPASDPETGTRLVTRFDGRVRADTVAGSFTTWVERTSGTQMGGWRVVRRT